MKGVEIQIMSPVQETKMHIIESAIAVLKEVGTEGLTMRRVAAESSMSLGNLQYHFKDKTALMGGLAELYFNECSTLLAEYQHTPEDGTIEEKLNHLILEILDHVDHISDMCKIFREIWALATRNDKLHSQLVEYYKTYFENLTQLLNPLCSDDKSAKKMASLLMPYIEGYSITVKALPQSKNETAAMLTESCLKML